MTDFVMVESSDPEVSVHANDQYVCPKHGPQGSLAGMSVTLSDHGGLHENLKPYVGTKLYCWACWIDWMDANMCQLEVVKVTGELEPSPSSQA